MLSIDRSQENSSLAVLAGVTCVLLLPIIISVLLVLTMMIVVEQLQKEDGVTPLGEYVHNESTHFFADPDR
jgi:hypothetical protein